MSIRYVYQAPEARDLDELTAQFHENTGFLIVRHPFVRLVSAYEDKMLNPHPYPYAYHHRSNIFCVYAAVFYSDNAVFLIKSS